MVVDHNKLFAGVTDNICEIMHRSYISHRHVGVWMMEDNEECRWRSWGWKCGQLIRVWEEVKRVDENCFQESKGTIYDEV